MSLPSVTLAHAVVFVCEECGRDSFARMVNISPDEAEEMGLEVPREAADAPPGFEAMGSFECCPTDVTCQHCGAKFEADEPDFCLPLEPREGFE